MKVLIEKYRPQVNLKKLDINDFCLEYVKANWLEKRFFEKIAQAVNQGFAGNENNDIDSEEIFDG
jgi:hypothetical protein